MTSRFVPSPQPSPTYSITFRFIGHVQPAQSRAFLKSAAFVLGPLRAFSPASSYRSLPSASLLEALDEAALGKRQCGYRVTFAQPLAGAGGRFRWFTCHRCSLPSRAITRGANELIRRSGDGCRWERLALDDGPFIALSATGSDDLIFPGAWRRHPRLQVFGHWSVPLW